MSNGARDTENKSLEMRVAAIEDKLSKLSISEEDLRGYQKVASVMAGSAGQAPTLSPFLCWILCWITHVVSIPTPVIQDCIQASATGPTASTGFESLGRK